MIAELKEARFKISEGVVERFQNDLLEFYRSHEEGFGSIVIDLSDIDYLEVVTMIYLIALIDNLQSENKQVRMILPSNPDVRNTLRIWRFPIVLREAIGIPFSQLVVTDSLKYFGENKLAGDYYSRFEKSDGGLRELVAKGFFSLTSLPFEQKEDKANAVIDEHVKWSDDAVKSILKKYLEGYTGKKDSIIPNRIIYECMTNAVRHSEADKLIVGSFFDKVGKCLTISFWDNGKSIITTLQNARQNSSIRNEKYNTKESESNLNFAFVSNKEESPLQKNIYYSDENPTEYQNESELFLASFYPGVSQYPDGEDGFNPSPFLNENDLQERALKSPGMGLTTLLNAVIDLMGGTITVRANNYFLNIKRPQASVLKKFNKSGNNKFNSVYQVKIEKFPDYIPELKGNMITIRLPLSNV